jgi:hypothetical protein
MAVMDDDYPGDVFGTLAGVQDREPLQHARRDLEAPPLAEQLAKIHEPRVVNMDDEPDTGDWYASAADERVAQRFDDDDTYQPRVRQL